MVAAVHHVERRVRAHGLQRLAEELQITERVACTLNEEARDADVAEVRRAELLGLARRVQGIAEQDEAQHHLPLGGEVGCHSSAHRLSTDDEPRPGRSPLHAREHLAVGRLELGSLVGDLLAEILVLEVEARDAEAALLQGGGDVDEERVLQVTAGAVREHEQEARGAARLVDDERPLRHDPGQRKESWYAGSSMPSAALVVRSGSAVSSMTASSVVALAPMLPS